jgi:cytochrome c oxidase subunit III
MSGTPRSMEATEPAAVRAVASARRAKPSGWWGVALLIATEAALFGTLIASYFYLRFNSATWPPRGIAAPHVLTPTILTAVLVSTSVPMALAARAARGGRARPAWLALATALAIQAAYLGYQLSDFVTEVDKHPPSGGAYSSIYDTLLGAHHFHVGVGILLVLALLVKLARGLTSYRAVGVGAIALYWHFTNAVAVAVLLTQLYPAL